MKRILYVTGSVLLLLLKVVVGCLCLALTCSVLLSFLLNGGNARKTTQNSDTNYALTDRYNMFITNTLSDTLDGVLSIPKTYWLNDDDLVAPKPNPDGYGTTQDPASLQWLLDKAAPLLDGQDTLFTTQTPVHQGSTIHYYYDETILVITWKQIINNCVHTISEVKIAHPSQFRRGLAGGEFGSDKQFSTTQMAKNVNAVVATSGDFYKFRRVGAIAYQGELRRFEGKSVDTCFINEDGDVLFAYRGDLKSEAEALKFIEDNKVRYSLAFGPILVDDGKNVTPSNYGLGEINEEYSRAALCQMDKLHYLFVNSTGEPKKGMVNRQVIKDFAENLGEMGVDKAYALDGGQTTVIAMDGKLISYPDFGTQRLISDILYFATALPDGG